MLGAYGGYSRPPRRVTTAYMFYVKTHYRHIVEQQEIRNIRPNPTNVVLETARNWKTLNAEVKARFKLMEQLDRERYKADKKEWALRFGGKAPRQRRKSSLECGAPVRTRNPFIFFEQAHWAQLPKRFSHAQCIKELARWWRILPEDEKEIYRDMSRNDKVRYTTELRDFLQQKLRRQAQQHDEFLRQCNAKDVEVGEGVAAQIVPAP